LDKIINQELHNLRPTSTNDSFTLNPDKQNLFAQAVFIRSIDLNLIKMRQMIRTYYEGVGQSLRGDGKKVQQLIDDHSRQQIQPHNHHQKQRRQR
jgi:hypothetical protein